MNRSRSLFIVNLASCLAGTLYGILLRVLAIHKQGSPAVIEVVTLAFLGAGPFAVGFITVLLAENRERQRIWTWIFLPWVPIVCGLAAMMLLLLEGVICIVMYAPLGLVLATIGGLVGGLIARSNVSWRGRMACVAVVAVLPFFVQSVEQPIAGRSEVREVATSIDIHSDPATVWRNIERVPAIPSSEIPRRLSYLIGFPKPVEATLSFEGVGGVRHATFERGVLFVETVDVWEPQRRLAFSIRADTEHIPNTTLDEHVRIGGPYFDMLRGEYQIEPLADGIRLHLTSHQRLSTDLNWYARLWTTKVMEDLQSSILTIIKARCEAEHASN